MVVVTVCLTSHVARADIDADQVRLAIERGVDFLRTTQSPDGSWAGMDNYPSGVTSLVTLALLNAGVPVEDPMVQKALVHLRKHKLDQTYTVGLQTMVFCAAEPKKDLLLIQQNVRWIEEMQHREDPVKKGGWGYAKPVGNADNSNAQLAVLALHEAERVGVPIHEQTWRLANEYWLRQQNGDGSWGYMDGYPGTGSMTCAGIGALVVSNESLGRGAARIDAEGNVDCCQESQDDPEIERGLDWMARHFSVDSNPGNRGVQAYLYYYLYGLERVGRLTSRRFIGTADWYREGAAKLVANQLELDGSWRGTGHAEDNAQIATSMAILFLAKGRRPILISKLKHEPGNDWDRHPSDLANLTTYVEKQWKRDLAWQVVDPQHATTDDLLQSPVLFISGREAPQFSDAQVHNIRQYIDRGGFVFAEAACGTGAFDAGFRAFVERLFPELEYRLTQLGPEHPIWSAEERVDPDFAADHPLYGIEAGCRTSLVYSPADLGCYWELARAGREETLHPRARRMLTAARAIGINVLAYATNRELKYKLDVPLDQRNGPTDPFDRAKVYVAKLKHSGGWNIAPAALPTLLRTLAEETHVRVNSEQRELAVTDPKLFDYHMAFMHGRHSFQFSEAERKQLREYLQRGGLLLADAVCSSDEFARSFEHEMSLILPEQPLKAVPSQHPLFTKKYGGFDLQQVERREPAPGDKLRMVVRRGEPVLEGIELEGRYVVLFSPYDLSCALERRDSLECPGYSRDDAARIGLNVMLYSLEE